MLETKETQVVAIPEQAIVPVNDKHFVYLVSADNLALRREVKIGRREQGYVEIQQGLALTEEIVVEGAFKLQPGYPVKVLAAKGKSSSVISAAEQDDTDSVAKKVLLSNTKSSDQSADK